MTDLPSPMPPDGERKETVNRLGRKRCLWLWFVAGFFLVFIGMLLTMPMHSMHPSGNALIICKLWQYYLMEIPRALSPWQVVGPVTGNASALTVTALLHVLFSTFGGAVMLAVGWLVGKIKRAEVRHD
jgi:hypothetical protein